MYDPIEINTIIYATVLENYLSWPTTAKREGGVYSKTQL